MAIASEVLGRPVQIFLPSNDGRRDGAFIGTWKGASDRAEDKSIQCKHSGRADASLTLSQLKPELPKYVALVVPQERNNDLAGHGMDARQDLAAPKPTAVATLLGDRLVVPTPRRD
jgi:hypothetical protein